MRIVDSRDSLCMNTNWLSIGVPFLSTTRRRLNGITLSIPFGYLTCHDPLPLLPCWFHVALSGTPGGLVGAEVPPPVEEADPPGFMPFALARSNMVSVISLR